MELYANCMMCLLNGQLKKLKDVEDDDKKQAFFKAIMKVIAESGDDACAPWLASQITRIYEDIYQIYDDYAQDKWHYNQFVLALEAKIREQIHDVKDAFIYARIGNYIDFSAVDQVSEEQFLALLHRENDDLDEVEYQYLLTDLQNAKTLVYLLDNCGEIVLDKLVMEQLKKQYPKLKIVAMCRGKQVINDATIEDCKQVGLDQIVTVMDNGDDCAGTILKQISKEAFDVINQADVIISKGQGNFESLAGCGLNVYYLFLCKCDWFMKQFNVERYHGMLLNEQRYNKNHIKSH